MTQSPIGDDRVTETPKPQGVQQQPNDLEKLANHKNYPQLHAWLEEQKEGLRKNLPAPGASREEQEVAWQNAVWGITFIESFQREVERVTKK